MPPRLSAPWLRRFRELFANTERTRMQAELQASEARYRLMFEENTAVQIVADLETGVLVDANPAALAFYGYPRRHAAHE